MTTNRFATIWEKSTEQPPWQTRHDLTAGQYQETFDDLTRQGYRPTFVNGYTCDGQGRFAAIFEQEDGPAFVARHEMGAEQYQQALNQLASEGYRPTMLSVYTSGGEERFAGIWDQSQGPSAWAVRYGLTAEQYQHEFDDLTGQGYIPTVVNGYSVNGQVRFAAIFEKWTASAPLVARHEMSAQQYQQTFDRLAADGYRPIVVSGYTSDGQDRFAALWMQLPEPPWVARHNLTSEQYQQTVDDLSRQGYAPRWVDGMP